MMFANIYKGRRVLVTGHTGFKGSWLTSWLLKLGADVVGVSKDVPTKPAMFEKLALAGRIRNIKQDIRDLATMRELVVTEQPDFVFHLAAQAIVSTSYADPAETISTNVIGTMNILESLRQLSSPCVAVMITSDKCYDNVEWVWGYRENEPLGGYDPYSSSKGCSELVTSGYRRSFFQEKGIALASARAGNVIGGGDWAADRLIPDILRAFEQNQPVIIRNPHATRPWQHVLEPLSGYLTLAERLCTDGQAFAEGWNFGPHDDDASQVQWIVEHMVSSWSNGASWQLDGGAHPHEANYLKLDISKAKARLGWQPRWALSTALEKITAWHHAYLASTNMHEFTMQQIANYAQTHKE